MPRTVLRRLLGIVTFIGVATAAAAADDYSIVERWTTGGSGGWDYLAVDAPRQRLFVTRGDHVDVVDTRSGKLIGTIPGTAGVHGVALAPERRRGYTSNGRSNTVTEFDYDSLAVLRQAAVPGENPDAILFDAASQRLFTFNGRSKDATVFDPATLAVVATLPMPDKPEFAAADGHGQVFVNIESEVGQIVAIDARGAKVTATWPLPGCATPTGLAVDREHARLFSVCDGKVMAVTDATNGHPVARVAIGSGPDAAAYDPTRGLVFSSNGEGSLTVVRERSPDSYEVAETLQTQRGARTMALDPQSGRVYLVTAAFGPAPAATAEQPHPRPVPVPGSFTVLVAAPQ
jgi:DNA-binding beta-propeller fold protein YncE